MVGLGVLTADGVGDWTGVLSDGRPVDKPGDGVGSEVGASKGCDVFAEGAGEMCEAAV